MSLIKHIAVLLLVKSFCLVECKQIEIWNRRSGKVWVGAHANKGFPLPNGGGWQLRANQMVEVALPDTWVGRFWPRTFCNLTNDDTCETGGCGSNFKCRGLVPETPATVIEFKFNPKGDQYSISLVNGFNTKVTVMPTGPEARYCSHVACAHPFIDKCPKKLQKDFNNVYVSGCHSPCSLWGTDEYCCQGDYRNPVDCNPENWPVNYAKIFKDKCPKVKTYVHDKQNVWHSCKARTYSIIFEE